MRIVTMIAAAAALLLGAPALAQEAPAAPDYSSPGHWLCLPGRADPCGSPLPTTALNPNGYGSVGRSVPATNPPVDCFYVYPTVSRDAGDNSDLTAGPEEIATASVQIARFSTVCRTYAPLYRQATLTALLRQASGGAPRTAEVLSLAYVDVLAAWRLYLQHHNKGRPFVLIGHSQGTIHLTRLLAEEIEGKEPARRMLSAILLGFTVEVPEGQTVGGTFKQTPLCTKRGQTGCVVTYMSFRATNPPPEGSLFGRALRPGMTAACTNPAALGGGSGRLDSYWFTGGTVSPGEAPVQWSSQGPPSTLFVRTDGLVSAACVHRGRVGYLSLLENADPSDSRTDRVPGDVYIAGKLAPSWGMHRADMSVAQGDLIALVEAQAKAR